MVIISNNDKNDDSFNLGNDNNASNEIWNTKNNNMLIIVENWRMIEINKIVKRVCFQVIPYINSLVKLFSTHINGDHNHFSRCKSNIFKLNGLNRRDKTSFDAMLSSNIPSPTVLLKKLWNKSVSFGTMPIILDLTIVLNKTLHSRQPHKCFRATLI